MKKFFISIAYGSNKLGKGDTGTAYGSIIVEVPGDKIDIKQFELLGCEDLEYMQVNKFYNREEMIKMGYVPEIIQD